MASRIIHLCISTKVCSKMKLDESRFMLGNLAPDTSLNKEKSHFVLGSRRDEKACRYIDYDAFIHEYYKVLQDSFILGYLCHLVSDELWHSEIYKKYLLTADDKERDIVFKKYYSDFERLNSKLINYYGLNKDIFTLENAALKQFGIDDIEIIINEINKDFNISEKMLYEELELFKFDEIVDYIEKALVVTINKINEIRECL